MITDSFDLSKSIITPGDLHSKKSCNCDFVIPTFSGTIYEHMKKTFKAERVGRLHAANRSKSIYTASHRGKKFAFYLSELGAALASKDIVNVSYITGATKFIMYGSAGVLDSRIGRGTYIIPTEAYRGEGTSYYYMQNSDYIDVMNAYVVENIFYKLNIPYVKGRVWTTDVPYRESEEMVQRLYNDGCLAVEMELAGVQAACNYYGINLFYFLEAGDCVNTTNYTPKGIGRANHSISKLDVALKIMEII